LGNTNHCNIPTEITYFKDTAIKQIACGQLYTIVLTHSGKIYGWGQNYDGQLGLGDQKNRKNPTEITYFKQNCIKIKNIECGAHHTFALSDDEKIYEWGLITSYLNDGSENSQENRIFLPRELLYFKKHKIQIKQIICKDFYNIAICKNDNIYGWGIFNSYIKLPTMLLTLKIKDLTKSNVFNLQRKLLTSIFNTTENMIVSHHQLNEKWCIYTGRQSKLGECIPTIIPENIYNLLRSIDTFDVTTDPVLAVLVITPKGPFRHHPNGTTLLAA
jgi:alpha-tubulin suppressor-like RCC1 family protein